MIVAVLVSALAGWVFGAIWYSILARHWVAASGVTTDASGKPANRTQVMPYLISIVANIIVSATMYYAFDMLRTETFRKGFTSGLGIGACFAAPWLAMSYGFAGRPFKLSLIDGGYAALGSGVIGAVITLF
ncbi:DUF1761 domain-containing protein [Marivita sp.]|uniref:DUF1761 domain-containing protein n=1 Tax=Marivita sp. TaxID=2003365 RepID=UPI003F6C6693